MHIVHYNQKEGHYNFNPNDVLKILATNNDDNLIELVLEQSGDFSLMNPRDSFNYEHMQGLISMVSFKTIVKEINPEVNTELVQAFGSFLKVIALSLNEPSPIASTLFLEEGEESSASRKRSFTSGQPEPNKRRRSHGKTDEDTGLATLSTVSIFSPAATAPLLPRPATIQIPPRHLRTNAELEIRGLELQQSEREVLAMKDEVRALEQDNDQMRGHIIRMEVALTEANVSIFSQTATGHEELPVLSLGDLLSDTDSLPDINVLNQDPSFRT